MMSRFLTCELILIHVQPARRLQALISRLSKSAWPIVAAQSQYCTKEPVEENRLN